MAMKLLDSLERRFGDIPPLNITYYLIFGQIFVFFLVTFYPQYNDAFYLNGRLALDGEWWRLVTFLFEPITRSFIFAALTWYIFYIYGTTLERYWGTFRYLVYILIVALGSIIIAFVFPDTSVSNGYIFTSLFLAFAQLFPNFRLMLFFILPVKIKWIALITWIGIAVTFLFGTMPIKVMTIVSVANFLFFFWDEIIGYLKHSSVQSTKKIKEVRILQKPEHICNVCGKNNIDNPDMGIRYCSKCKPEKCFCEDDFLKHAHTHATVVN